MHNKRASWALALPAGRVDGRPFSAIGPIVYARVLNVKRRQRIQIEPNRRNRG